VPTQATFGFDCKATVFTVKRHDLLIVLVPESQPKTSNKGQEEAQIIIDEKLIDSKLVDSEASRLQQVSTIRSS
jgi:hypothetical protein